MAAKLINCTKEEQHSVIRFLWAEGGPGEQIHLRMCAQYGDKVFSRRIVYEWTELFENGHRSLTDAERSRLPASATTTRNEERTLEMIHENRRITVEEVAGRLNVSVGSAYSLIHDSLMFSKLFAMWVPKGLTEERKRQRLDVCSRHLSRYHEESDNFLQQIVTGDETLIHSYEPESKRQSMQWKHPLSPVAKIFKMQPSEGKLMLTVISDSQEPILKTYQERGTTVTSATYCDILQGELKRTFCSKRRGKVSEKILLFHNNARLHTAAHTLETLKQLKWEAMEHPAYSPNLAPSDFHLFGPLKNARRFSCDDDVNAAVYQWLRAQPKTFFADGNKKLVGRWEKMHRKAG